MNSRLLALLAATVLSSSARADVLDHWTTNQLSTNYFGLDHVVYGNGRYVAAGEYSDYEAIVSSDDGLHWTLRADGQATGTPGWGMSLIYSGGQFIGLDTFAVLVRSTNGVDWIYRNMRTNSFPSTSDFAASCGGYPVSERALKGGVIFDGTGPGGYVVAGSTNGNGCILQPFGSGSPWFFRSISPAPGGSIADVAYGNGNYAAVGNNDGYAYSRPSGGSWLRNSIPGGDQITFCNGLFLIVLNAGTNLISSDGLNWAAVNTGLTNKLGRPSFSHGLFMARAGSHLATSADGTNWVQYPQLLPGQSEVASDGAHLVTVGSTAAGTVNYNGVAYYSDVLVGLRVENTTPAQIVLSGLVGRTYRLESTDVLPVSGTNIWQPLITLQLPNTPYIFVDTTAINSSRFYRAVLLP